MTQRDREVWLYPYETTLLASRGGPDPRAETEERLQRVADQTDVYLRLDYRQYKALERQLDEWRDHETTHTSVGGPDSARYYHKAIRLDIGNLTLEVQGPAVREAIREDGHA